MLLNYLQVADFGLANMSGVRSATDLVESTVAHIAPERYTHHPFGDGDDENIKLDLEKNPTCLAMEFCSGKFGRKSIRMKVF